MASTRSPVLTVLVAACLLGAPLQAGATAIANSSLDFRNLAITPAAGVFSLDGVWSLEAFAQAGNSLGELDAQFTPGNSPGTVGAAAAVTWASAQGNAAAPNAPPDLAVTGSAQSSVNLPDCGPAAAFSNSRGTLFNSFTLNGAGPSVNVQFAIDISGMLNLMTNYCGVFASTETVFTLEVDGQPVLFDARPRQIGPSDLLIEPFTQHLMATVPLATGSHFLLLEADSESSALVAPEPPAGVLLVAGLVALAAARRRPVLVRLGK